MFLRKLTTFAALVSALALGLSVAAAQTVWYVDDDAPNDPCPGDPTDSDPLEDGTTEHPFDSIQKGIYAASVQEGDEVLVADGVYTGWGNKNLNFDGHAMTVRSENGPKNCTIDCQQDGRGALFHRGETRLSILEGFTITNGDPSGTGGGIQCEASSSPTIRDCIITNNVAISFTGSGSGGGIRCEDSSHPAIVGCTISNNTAGNDGGGISWKGEVDIEDALDITDCIISGNRASGGDGGGIDLRYGAPNISGCTIENNEAQADGGGIYFTESAPRITNCTISGNRAQRITSEGGGVGFYSNKPGIVIAGCTISDNFAGSSGGGLRAEEEESLPPADVAISDCLITGNRSWEGGGIWLEHFNGTFTNCTIADNSAFFGRIGIGGGVVANEGDATFVNCSIADNTAELWGGGIAGSGTFLNCSIAGNRSIGGLEIYDKVGGGISGGGTFVNCSITGNFAEDWGGGIYVSTPSSLFIDCTIAGNSSDFAGGGVAFFDYDVTFVSCLIADNFAAEEGGGIFCAHFSPHLLNCTITGNVAGFLGGGLQVEEGSNPVITNSILWGDEPEEINIGHRGESVTVNYSDVEGGGWPGVGNIDLDPMFVDPDGPDNDPGTWEDNNRHIVPGSPCIDAGDPDYIPEPGEVDIDGEPRIVDGDGDEEATIDMGADEYNDCNENDVPDYQDIADGTSADCSANSIPDECEPDCNENGETDSCDIFDGKSQDCNDNQIPDDCESDADCNNNGVQDFCDLAEGSSADCNGNEVPDECDIADDPSQDCNGNSVPDECDPDEDCNSNGVQDVCDIAEGTSQDCNGNSIPDECEEDCNANGVLDECDIADGTSQDCNFNDVPDECDIADGTSEDDDGNGVPDECNAVVVSIAGPTYALPGETVAFEFMISADPEFFLSLYVITPPCALTPQDGATGTVGVGLIALDTGRGDWVFCGAPCNCTCLFFDSVYDGDCAGDPPLDPSVLALPLCVSDSPAVGVGPAYLAETSYTISGDATGSFDFEFVDPATPDGGAGSLLLDDTGALVFPNWIGTTVVIVDCLVDGDCDDGDVCTDDTCDGVTGECVFTNNTAACDDGDACTEGDVCADAVCAGTAVEGCCTSDDDCAGDDVCNLDTNQCEPAPPPCTDDDACDDQVACTDDSCDLDTGQCLFTPNDANCANADFCDGNETCDPADAGADADGCVAGTDPCAAGGSCDETNDNCGTPFTEHVISTTADYARTVFAADLDGDGDTDVLSASTDDDKIAWYESDGGSPPSFTERAISTTADGANTVFATDLDGDGDTDVLSASTTDNKIAWYENDGGSPPTFTERVISTAADGPQSVFAADVDGDGDTDVLSASNTNDDNKIAWYENNGGSPPFFSQRTISTELVFAKSVFATDVDGDGDIDVLAVFGEIVWFENDGGSNPSFTEHLISDTDAYSVFATDVDGDGDTDVLYASRGDDKIAWYENDGGSPPTFTERVISTTADFAYSVYATDVDGDGDTDVLSASGHDNKIAWYQSDGGSPPSFTEHVISTTADGAESVFATDLDGDGDIDVLSASGGDNKIAWYENTTPSCEVQVYADICLQYDPPDGPQPNLDDILCLLDDFADGPAVDGCACDGFRNTTDLYPCPEDGGGDGEIGLDDILNMLDAFAGLSPCDDPCP